MSGAEVGLFAVRIEQVSLASVTSTAENRDVHVRVGVAHRVESSVHFDRVVVHYDVTNRKVTE